MGLAIHRSATSIKYSNDLILFVTTCDSVDRWVSNLR